MRTIVVGDIHGCAKALRGLLDDIKPTVYDHLIFLGDYVDRGPDSKGVLDILLDLKSRCNTTFLLGNHEIMFRGVLRGLEAGLWMQIGGSQTVTSYGGKLENVSSRHREFLESELVPYFEAERHLYVHANYHAELDLAQQPEEALFWEHLSDRVPLEHHTGKHVFLGHSPQSHGNVGYFGHFTCLDTGCFAGYWLSAVDVESGEVWQYSKEGHRRENWRLAKRIWQKMVRLKGRIG